MTPKFLRAEWLGGAKAVLHRSRILYTPLSIGVIAWLVLRDPAAIGDRIAFLDPRLLGGMFLLIAAGHFFISVASRLLFVAQGHGPELGLVLRTHINRLPARYLPGGIWQTVSRAADFADQGVPHRLILRVLLLETGVSACLAAILGSGLLLVRGGGQGMPYLGLVAVCGIAGLILGPALVRERDRTAMRGPVWAYPGAVGAYSLVWGLYGGAFYLFLSQLVPSIPWGEAVGVYLVSWLAGFLAFFAPQGIGVFEVSASLLLTGGLAAAFLGALFAFRILTMAADIGVWAGFRVWIWARGITLPRADPPPS